MGKYAALQALHVLCARKKRLFLGKKFETVCYYRIDNPDSKGLGFTKFLLEYKKQAIANSIL